MSAVVILEDYEIATIKTALKNYQESIYWEEPNWKDYETVKFLLERLEKTDVRKRKDGTEL